MGKPASPTGPINRTRRRAVEEIEKEGGTVGESRSKEIGDGEKVSKQEGPEQAIFARSIQGVFH